MCQELEVSRNWRRTKDGGPLSFVQRPAGTTSKHAYCKSPYGVIQILMPDLQPHTEHRTLAHIREKKWELLSHPPYSLDLALSDFFLFGPMKNALRGTRFGNLNEIKKALNKWFKEQREDWFREGLQKLVEDVCYLCTLCLRLHLTRGKSPKFKIQTRAIPLFKILLL